MAKDIYIEEVKDIPVDFYGDVRTLVRGLPYQCPDDWEDILDSLNEDSELYLVKEPDNPKDELAIAAYLGNRRVGYVAASDNTKVWMFLTDEKTPCKFLQSYEASFKVSFENPRHLFENLRFEDIYKDKDDWIEKTRPIMEVPFLTDVEDESYDWYRDIIVIRDFEEFVPDFRRKLAAKMITFVARKNSQGNYRYYLPYINAAVAVVEDDLIKNVIDTDGFVIAIPEISKKTYPGGIHIRLNVAKLPSRSPLIKQFKAVEEVGNKELVFYLSSNIVYDSTKEEDLTEEGRNEDMEKFNRTKSITLKRPFSFEGVSMAEVYKLRNIFEQLQQHKSISCVAQKQGTSIRVYLDDGSLFHIIMDDTEYFTLNGILNKEKILVGEVYADERLATDKYLIIKLYYDYVSGNHDDSDICNLWLRDFAAKLREISVPKAKYVGKESKADKLEKESVGIDFPCYEDEDFDSFDFTQCNYTHKELNEEIISVTDKHQEDLYHNTPFVVLARQNPALPMLYEFCLPDGTMFGIIGEDDPEDITLRKWIGEVGIVPVTVQSYELSITGTLELHCRAFKRKSNNQKLKDFVAAHFIEDTVDIEMDEDDFERISEIIDPEQDGSMTDNLNVVALIPNWASQAAYYIVREDERIWLAPSYNADILDQVHQNNWTQGRVVSYRDNYDGTYHFELKFHIEK